MKSLNLRGCLETSKRSGSCEKVKSRFRKGAQGKNEPNVKLEKGGSSQNVKPTCVTSGKRHYGECLRSTWSFYGCGKEGHKLRDCPNITSRGKKGKKVAPDVPKEDVPKAKARFCALFARGSKLDENEYDDEGKSLHLFLL